MRTIVLAAALTIGAAGLAYADMPGSGWMTKEQVTKKLEGLGYTDVRKLEADDGHWEGDAKIYEIHVDPHSGELTKNEPKHHDE